MGQTERRAGDGPTRHRVIFLDYNRVQRGVIKGHAPALAAVDMDGLRGGFPHLESRRGGHFPDGVLAGIEADAAVMQGNLAIGIGVQFPEIVGGGSAGRAAAAGVGDVELGSLNGSAAHGVQLVNIEGRRPVVFEHQTPDFTRPQTDGLCPVRVVFGQIVRGGDGFLRNPVGSRFNPFRNRTVRAGGPVGGIAVVHARHGEHRAGNDSPVQRINLDEVQQRIFQVLKHKLPLGTSRQRDSPHVMAVQRIRGRDGSFRNPVAAGSNLCRVFPVVAGGPVRLIIHVNSLNIEHDAGNGRGSLRVNLQNGKKRFFQIIEYQRGMFPRAQPDGLCPFGTEGVGSRDVLLRDFVIIHGNPGQRGGSVRAGGHFLLIAGVNAHNFKCGVGDRSARGGVLLLDGEIGQLLVRRRDRDEASALDVSLIHIDADRLVQFRVPRRSGNLHKDVHPGFHVVHGDFSGGVRFLRGDNLPVFQDIEHRAGEGIVGVVQLHQLNFHFRVVLKDKLNFRRVLADTEGFHVGGIQAVPLRGGHFPCPIGTGLQRTPFQPLQSAARAGCELAVKAVIHTLNGDGRARQSFGRVVRVHLADAPGHGNGGRVGEHFLHHVFTVTGQGHIVRPRVVDGIAAGGHSLRDRVNTGGEVIEGVCPVASGGSRPGRKRLVRGGHNAERRARQCQIGIGGVHLPHRQAVIAGDGGVGNLLRVADENRLDGAVRVIVFVDRTLTPRRGIGQNHLRHALKCVGAARHNLVVDGGVACPVPGVVALPVRLRHNLHLTLIVRRNLIRGPQPDHFLNPAVVLENGVAGNLVVEALGDTLIVPVVLAQQMSIVVTHHNLYHVVCDGLRAGPGIPDVAVVQPFGMVAAEAGQGEAAHLHMKVLNLAGPLKVGGLVVAAGPCDAFQFDGAVLRPRRDGEQGQDADRRQQQSGQPPEFLANHCCHAPSRNLWGDLSDLHRLDTPAEL